MGSCCSVTYTSALFDTRLIAFHPQTHLIRAFVNYDVINDFHGMLSNLPKRIPEEVLQYHLIQTILSLFLYIYTPLTIFTLQKGAIRQQQPVTLSIPASTAKRHHEAG